MSNMLLIIYAVCGIGTVVWMAMHQNRKGLKLSNLILGFLVFFLSWPILVPLIIIPEICSEVRSKREWAVSQNRKVRFQYFVKALASMTREEAHAAFPTIRQSDSVNIRDSARDILEERTATALNKNDLAQAFDNFAENRLFKNAKGTVPAARDPSIYDSQGKPIGHFDFDTSGRLAFTDTFFESVAWLSFEERQHVVCALIRIDEDWLWNHPATVPSSMKCLAPNPSYEKPFKNRIGYCRFQVTGRDKNPKFSELKSDINSYNPTLFNYPAGDWMILVLPDHYSASGYVLTVARC